MKQIIFGSRVIKLNFIDKKLASKKNIMGEFDSNANTITLDKSLRDTDLINTILHETYHMLLDEYCIELSTKDEELVCNSLANGICHTLYQNQDLLDFLYKSLKKD
jgi:hypothetical protein